MGENVNIANMTTLQKLDACASFLDQLVDAKGRAKCGYIYILSDVLERIRQDVIAMQGLIAAQAPNNQNGEEIKITPLSEEEVKTNG